MAGGLLCRPPLGLPFLVFIGGSRWPLAPQEKGKGRQGDVIAWPDYSFSSFWAGAGSRGLRFPRKTFLPRLLQKRRRRSLHRLEAPPLPKRGEEISIRRSPKEDSPISDGGDKRVNFKDC